MLEARHSSGLCAIHVGSARTCSRPAPWTIVHFALVDGSGRVQTSVGTPWSSPALAGLFPFTSSVAPLELDGHLDLPSEPVRFAPARASPELDELWAS